MNSDIRLSVGFWRHPKVFRLEKKLGLKGIRSLQILWCWCAQNRPDGDLSDLDAGDIEFVADWRGRKGAFFEACLGTWIDETEAGYALHEWADYNPYQAQAENREAVRKEKARNAANARWGKERNNDTEIRSSDAQAYANECSSICSSDARSNAQAMPAFTLTSTEEIKEILNPPKPPLQGGKAEKARRDVLDSRKQRKGENRRENLQAIMASWTENPALLARLEDYRQMRERIRKPMTAEALRLALAKLDKLAGTDEMKIAILEQSILNSWQGLFELRPEGPQSRASPAMSWQEREDEAFQRAIEEARKRDEARAAGEAI